MATYTYIYGHLFISLNSLTLETNLFAKHRERQSCRQQMYGHQAGRIHRLNGEIRINACILSILCIKQRGFPGGSVERICLQCRRQGFSPWVGKIPWRRKWQPTPVFLPGESHGQRSLAGCSPRGRKESDTTERLSTRLK